MKALKSLFLNELADMYDAERRITKALPKVIKAATCEKLQQALNEHLDETQGHVEKVEQIFATLEEKPKTTKCEAIAGILEEGEKLLTENKKSPAINAAVICACQKVEHYEMATYGTLRAWAQTLGNERAANIIEEILEQEKEADRTLNELAESKNQEAMRELESAGASA